MSGTEDRGRVTLAIDGDVAQVTFDRPAARNAMTFEMYRQLDEACARIDATEGLRVAVFRGAGGAFVAGTDIAEFTAFRSGEDGVAYEERVEKIITRLENLTVPSIAVVDGAAVGGGLILAAVCDFRLATPAARFGIPIARTLGNCLSLRNAGRLERIVGPGPARRMLLLSELIDGEAAERIGFALACLPPEMLESRLQEVIARLRAGAPLTISAGREVFRRLARGETRDEDLVSKVYGSRDFAEGVRAFLDKRKPAWEGH